MRAHRPASPFLCTLPANLMEITRGDFPRQLFRICSAARNAPFALPRVNQNRWKQAFIAARKAESLPSTVSASYNVRNRTSMTQSRRIVAFSK
jgi:hypothetical protein